MIRVNKINNMLNVSFEYNSAIVANIKTIEGRRYNPNNRTWDIPLSGIKKLIELFGEDLNIAEDVDVNYEEDRSIFGKELNSIKDDSLRVFAKWCLEVLPDYFYTVAASSTGKYHPKYALGTGGLVRHTKAAIMIANELFNCETVHSFDDEQKDIIRVALLIHDGVKHGLNGSAYVVSTHPLEVIEHIQQKYVEADTEKLPQEVMEIMESRIWNVIAGCVKSHMGQWNTDYKTKEEILPKPSTEMEKFTHLCDYLASRKILEVNFEQE